MGSGGNAHFSKARYTHTPVHALSRCMHTRVHTQYTHTYPCMHMYSHMHICVCRALAERLPRLRLSMTR